MNYVYRDETAISSRLFYVTTVPVFGKDLRCQVYRMQWWVAQIFAGITVSLALIPEGIAFGMDAGVETKVPKLLCTKSVNRPQPEFFMSGIHIV